MRTALAAPDPQNHTAVLELLDSVEAQAFTRAFEKLGWKVLDAGDLLDILACTIEEPALLITDDPRLPKRLSEIVHIPMATVVVVDDRETAIEGATTGGADWLIVRPLDLDDPLGLSG